MPGRRFPRVQASLNLVVHAKYQHLNFRTFDVSANGISFLSKKYFNPFSKIFASLSFPLPNANDEMGAFKTILTRGFVVRIDRDFPNRTKMHPYRIAMALTSIDPLDQLEIDRFVRCLLRMRTRSAETI
jgi:hypothetical protein